MTKTIGVVGVCGANGNLIARILKERGFNVIGTDISLVDDCRFKNSLDGYDIKVYYGGNPVEFFSEIDCIVLPLGLSESSSLFKIIDDYGIPIWGMSSFLEDIKVNKPVFGITGTNGKSTSTMLLKKIAYDNGIIPSEHNLVDMQGNAEYIPILQSRLNGDVAILEVGTFGVKGSVERTCVYSGMDMGLITNITPDHLNSGFLDYARVKGEFIQVLNSKKLIVNCQDPTIMGLIKELGFNGDLVTFGVDWTFVNVSPKECVCGEFIDVKEIISGCGYYFCKCGLTTPESDYIATNIDLDNRRFDLFTPSGEKIMVQMGVDGLHNVYNITGVIIAAHEFLKLPFDQIVKSIPSFMGVSGRMEKIGNIEGKDIIVDYAHNPGGVETVLKSFSHLYSDFVIIDTIESESGKSGDEEIFDIILKNSKYVVACSKASQIIAREKIISNPSLKEFVFLPCLDEDFDSGGTIGASYADVKEGFREALNIDCEAIISIGEAGTKYKSCIDDLI